MPNIIRGGVGAGCDPDQRPPMGILHGYLVLQSLPPPRLSDPTPPGTNAVRRDGGDGALCSPPSPQPSGTQGGGDAKSYFFAI